MFLGTRDLQKSRAGSTPLDIGFVLCFIVFSIDNYDPMVKLIYHEDPGPSARASLKEDEVICSAEGFDRWRRLHVVNSEALHDNR